MDTFRSAVSDATGRPVSGATVAVYTAGTTILANLYNESGVGIANPITTNANGYYVFAAADGTYDIVHSGSGLTGITFRNVKLWDFATASTAPFSQVGLTLPADAFVVSGSPAGASGTLSVSWKTNATAALVLASPGSASGAIALRALTNYHLPDSGVAAATYGTATKSAAVIVNSKGVVTSASEITIAPLFSSIASKPTTVVGYGLTDGGRCAYVATADKTIGNTVTETTLFGTGEGDLTITGGTAVAGTTYRITLKGYVACSSSATIGVKVKIGAYDLLAVTPDAITSAATVPIKLQADITYRTIGATGSAVATLNVGASGAGALFTTSGLITELDVVNSSPTTINTTIDGELDVTWKFSVANAGNTITIQTATVEVLRG